MLRDAGRSLLSSHTLTERAHYLLQTLRRNSAMASVLQTSISGLRAVLACMLAQATTTRNDSLVAPQSVQSQFGKVLRLPTCMQHSLVDHCTSSLATVTKQRCMSEEPASAELLRLERARLQHANVHLERSNIELREALRAEYDAELQSAVEARCMPPPPFCP